MGSSLRHDYCPTVHPLQISLTNVPEKKAQMENKYRRICNNQKEKKNGSSNASNWNCWSSSKPALAFLWLPTFTKQWKPSALAWPNRGGPSHLWIYRRYICGGLVRSKWPKKKTNRIGNKKSLLSLCSGFCCYSNKETRYSLLYRILIHTLWNRNLFCWIKHIDILINESLILSRRI